MNFYKIFTIALLFSSFCFTSVLTAQVGGRKKEHRNQRGGGLFKRSKSLGHADKFARGGKKKGFFAKLFHTSKPSQSWTYRKTRPGKRQLSEQRFLFSRERTRSRSYREKILAKQNKMRSATRASYKIFSR
jgi:hypothetical protein